MRQCGPRTKASRSDVWRARRHRAIWAGGQGGFRASNAAVTATGRGFAQKSSRWAGLRVMQRRPKFLAWLSSAGGVISGQNDQDRGAVFEIRLPRARIGMTASRAQDDLNELEVCGLRRTRAVPCCGVFDAFIAPSSLQAHSRCTGRFKLRFCFRSGSSSEIYGCANVNRLGCSLSGSSP